MVTNVALLTTLLVFASHVLAIKNTVYIISNAETPSLGRPGLTPIGAQRAIDCVPGIFEPLDIGIIISCDISDDGEDGVNCPAAVLTATPLANQLGLDIVTCGTGDDSNDECVSNKLKKFAKNDTTSAALIIWDSDGLDDLLENIDADFPDTDDDNSDDDDDDDDLGTHPDVILTVVNNVITLQTSMNCTGIDGPSDDPQIATPAPTVSSFQSSSQDSTASPDVTGSPTNTDSGSDTVPVDTQPTDSATDAPTADPNVSTAEPAASTDASTPDIVDPEPDATTETPVALSSDTPVGAFRIMKRRGLRF
ncbi:hypothetical protein ABKN59_008867 [Abortiporus biennis]